MSTYEEHIEKWASYLGCLEPMYTHDLNTLLTEQRKVAEDRCANVVSVLGQRFKVHESAIAAILASIRKGGS